MADDSSLSSDEAIRRNLLLGGLATAVVAALPVSASAQISEKSVSPNAKGTKNMTTIVTKEGVELYYKDWGPKDGPVVTLSHGWPLNADSWDYQAYFLASHGFRVIAHDRRGHGRSSQPWDGNDMDHYADDLATVINTLNLRNVTVIGFSTGGGEVAR